METKSATTVCILHTYDVKNGKDEKSFLPQNRSAANNSNKKIRIIRISPFLITAFCLPVLFTYMVIQNIYSMWLLFFLFVFLQMNILIIDFAIWNYCEEKKIWLVWLIEMSAILLILYFIV